MRRHINGLRAATANAFAVAVTTTAGLQQGWHSDHFGALAVITAAGLFLEACWLGDRIITRHAANQRARRIAEDMSNHRQQHYDGVTFERAAVPVPGHLVSGFSVQRPRGPRQAPTAMTREMPRYRG